MNISPSASSASSVVKFPVPVQPSGWLGFSALEWQFALTIIGLEVFLLAMFAVGAGLANLTN